MPIAGRLPNTTAAPHTPEGSVAVNDAGQVPRTQPVWYQRLSSAGGDDCGRLVFLGDQVELSHPAFDPSGCR